MRRRGTTHPLDSSISVLSRINLLHSDVHLWAQHYGGTKHADTAKHEEGISYRRAVVGQ